MWKVHRYVGNTIMFDWIHHSFPLSTLSTNFILSFTILTIRSEVVIQKPSSTGICIFTWKNKNNNKYYVSAIKSVMPFPKPLAESFRFKDFFLICTGMSPLRHCWTFLNDFTDACIWVLYKKIKHIKLLCSAS